MKNNYLTNSAFLALVFSVLFSFVASAQNDYTVTPIPYQVYTATAPVQGTMDDTFSAPIALGFDFDFFGFSSNSVQVSTNGYISFATQAVGGFSPWSFNTTIPNVNFPAKNAFLGCFHDLNNSNGEGTITYSIIGSAPYRRLVVLFDNQSHFSCTTSKSTFQMVLYETLNILDVQLIDKQLCATWNGGRAVTGIIDSSGSIAFTPPNRNTGAWTAFHEGWRFQRPFNTGSYLFAKCDDDADGFVSFNLQVVQNDLSPADPLLVSFYETETAAISQTDPLLNLNYTNSTAGFQTIYANVNGEVKAINLRVVDCNSDFDLDSVATSDEDLNGDSNLANDDTDGDGIPNFIDNDDDGDMVLTSVEYVFNRNATAALSLLDTDGDTIPNYLDNEDDGDGVLTILEDYNGNNNPIDDDTNANTIPDYLENGIALGVNVPTVTKSISIYPNPTSSVLHIDNKSGQSIDLISIYSLSGALVKTINKLGSNDSVPVAELESGIYFIKIQSDNQVINHKFIRN